MKTAFLAALLLSAQNVWAQEGDEEPKKHFAYCEIYDRANAAAESTGCKLFSDEDGDVKEVDLGVRGCLLFSQVEGDSL